MSIQEKVMAPGTFTVSLSATLTPNSIINGIDPWGQILIHSTRVDENTLSNEDMIKNARYVGVVQNLEYDLDSFQVSGKGTMVYMGDTDSRGLVVAETSTSGSVRSYTNASLSDVLDRSTSQPFGLLRTGDTAAQQAVRTKTGSITNPTSGTTTYTGDHYLESVYKAVKFVCEHFDCEFFVDNQGFLFAGRPEDLFSGHDSDPTAIIIRQGQGEDPNIEGFIPAGITTGFNAEEFISKVELIPTQASKQVSMATATESSNPYKDLFNNSLKRIQVVKDASATQSNFQARANKALNEYNRLKKTVNVSLQGYDISGSFKVGDKIFIYDPEVGFEDDATKAADESRSIHQVTYQGSTINPEKIRVVGMSYPVQSGMGVYYRNGANGNILDLTDYVEFETGDISLEIGDVGGSLSSDFSTAAAIIATGTNDEFTIPDQPTKPSNGNAGFDHTTGSYRDGAGQVHGFIKLNWTTPQNKNGTTITDGSHFEIQWRMVSDRDGNNIIDSADAALGTNDYMVANVGFDQNTFVIENLNIGFTYTVRLIAFDVNGHSSDAVSVAAIQIPRSSIAPNKPATPSGTLGSLAAGLLRAQIVHNLAQVKDSDGNVISSPVNFTLDRDLSHLNVYGATSTFNLSYDSTNKKVSDSDRSTYYLGMIPCNNGNIDLNVAAVGTINLDSLNLTGNDTVHFRISAVNISGRESEPSDSFNTSGASTLVDTQHIKTAAITTALIGTAQITDAEVANMNVNKLVSGSISGKTITLAADSGTQSSIKSSNFSSGSAGFEIKSNGDAEFNDGNFRGDITGASGTFSGALSGATGTFSGSLSAATGTFSGNLSAAGGTFTGDISGASGTFTGDLSGSNISGGTIDIGGSDSTSFHVDSDGNMFLGAATIGSAPFKVTNAGAVTATSYTLTGGNINTATISNPSIELATNTGSSAPTAASSSALKIGTSTLFERSNKLFSSKPFVVFPDGDEDNPSLTISGDYDEMGFFVSNSTDAGGFSTFSASNGDDDIFSFTTLSDTFTVKGTLSVTGDTILTGNSLTVNGDSGSNNQFIGKDSSGNLGYHTVATGSHNHDSSYDDYGSWTLKRGGSTVGNVQSGFGASWNAGSGLSVSSNNNPFTITYSADFGGGNSQVARGDHSHTGTGISQINSPSVGFFNSYTFNSGTGAFAVSTTTTSSSSFTVGNLFPNSTSGNLGFPVSSKRWSNIYLQNSPNVSSDERKKEDIQDLIYGLDYINSLEPKSFKMKERENEAINFGFLAQDLYTTPPEPDIDIALVEYTEDTDDYGVRYTELIAPLVKAVQELSTQVSDLTARIEELEG